MDEKLLDKAWQTVAWRLEGKELPSLKVIFKMLDEELQKEKELAIAISSMTQEEKTKLIERTCKFDAYQRIYLWGRNSTEEIEHGSVLWLAKVKMDGHYEWLKTQRFRYAYVHGFIWNAEYKDTRHVSLKGLIKSGD